MGKCCICGKEAPYLLHGMWWCENHREMASKNPEEKPKPAVRETPSTENDLDLEWV